MLPCEAAASGATGARVGIMGGTFDPIHIGHLACAEQVREACALDIVLFVPAGDPWMKRGRDLAPAADRFAMVAAAVDDNPFFAASTLEIDRRGATYTVDTLRELSGCCPDGTELFFIAGVDAAAALPLWREADRLGSLATIAVVTRPGYDASDGRLDAARRLVGADRMVDVPIVGIDLSSTDVRAMVRAGRSIRYLVPREVADYIEKRGLYRA